MPSFFTFLKRMAKGEPAFQAGQTKSSSSSTQPPQPKTIPEVYIVRENCQINGTDMTCDAHVSNASNEPIFLDDITLFGTKTELQHQLDAGERREFQIYNGPVITDTYENDCYLRYRDENGDYFMSIHDVDCVEQPDGSQLVKRIRFNPPVKDI